MWRSADHRPLEGHLGTQGYEHCPVCYAHCASTAVLLCSCMCLATHDPREKHSIVCHPFADEQRSATESHLWSISAMAFGIKAGAVPRAGQFVGPGAGA